MTATDPVVPAVEPIPSTQVQHPWRTTLRTVAWYVLTVLAAIPLVVPILNDQLGGYWGERVSHALVWVAGLAGAVLAVVQRVVLLAPVNRLLVRLGIGPQPKSLSGSAL